MSRSVPGLERRVRPFDSVIERGSNRPASRLAGAIRDRTFVLNVSGQPYVLPTSRVGKDEHGDFAVLHEGEWPLDTGCILRIEAHADELDLATLPGTNVSLHWPSRHRTELESMAEQLLDAPVKVLPGMEDGLSIEFNWAGHVSGSGWLSRHGPTQPHQPRHGVGK